MTRRDLRRELAEAERQAAERKGIKAPPAPATKTIEGAPAEAADDSAEDPAAKRWKLVEGMGDLDKDDSDDEGETAEAPATNGDVKGKGKAVDVGEDGAESDEEDEDDDDSDDDDDEDETAELLRELEKIKRERAEEKERLERERNVDEEAEREERIAFGNPLLNLQNAFGNNVPGSPSPSVASSAAASRGFGVKRRWDDDVIFKNQAQGHDEKPRGEFVNDLVRTEFHRRFMKKFVA